METLLSEIEELAVGLGETVDVIVLKMNYYQESVQSHLLSKKQLHNIIDSTTKEMQMLSDLISVIIGFLDSNAAVDIDDSVKQSITIIQEYCVENVAVIIVEMEQFLYVCQNMADAI